MSESGPKSKDCQTENTGAKQLKPYWFKPGQSGNPAGRPKGSRNRLSEDFLKDMADAWEAEGASAIQKVIETKPDVFVKVAAELLPKDVNLNVNKFSDLTDEQLLKRVKALADLAAPLMAKMNDADGTRPSTTH